MLYLTLKERAAIIQRLAALLSRMVDLDHVHRLGFDAEWTALEKAMVSLEAKL